MAVFKVVTNEDHKQEIESEKMLDNLVQMSDQIKLWPLKNSLL